MKDEIDRLTLLPWKPGMKITSENEYQALTEELAKTLLRESTPEHLAEIAAQHLIYIDALELQAAVHKKAFQLEIATSDRLMDRTAQLLKAGADTYRKHASKVANSARYMMNRKRKKMALAAWDADPSTNKSEYADKHHAKYFVTQLTMYRWLQQHKNSKD